MSNVLDSPIYILFVSILSRLLRLGTSKRSDKRLTYLTAGDRKATYIHSKGTFNTYLRIIRYFAAYLISIGLSDCSLSEARSHAADYILIHCADLSIWTLKTRRSALAKLFGCSGPDICSLPIRHGTDIKRGRTITAREMRIEVLHSRTVEVLRSIGCRRHELECLKPINFFYCDGELCVHIVGKNGRERNSIIIGPGREFIEDDLASGKYGPYNIMYTIPSDANVHSYRADYAARCYLYAMASGLHSTQKPYHDYDRACLDFTSENLGHGAKRYYTIFYNYLSYGVAYR